MPSAPGVKLGPVAVPPLSVAPPSDVPPLAQPDAELSGPQTENDTFPVGVPATGLPLTTTPSLVESPSSTEASAGVDVVVL